MVARMRYDESQPHLFTIGEFSKITGLTIKALRFYHEQRLLVPARVDPQTGYRHYDQRQAEIARVISYLRGLEFPLDDVRELLRQIADDEQVLNALERRKETLRQKIRDYRKVVRSLDQFISEERKAQAMGQAAHDIQEKVLEQMLIAGIRMKGRYSDCGKAFARIARSQNRHICGKPFLLHYDDEFKEDDAEFEACMPVRNAKGAPDISVRELAGGRCVCLLHKGPYEQLGHSYAKILGYIKPKGYRIFMPTRELYLKGPGMIFKGDPANYLTEIQMPIQAVEPPKGDRDEVAIP